MNQDQEQLRLLSIFHYVVGGVVGLFAFFPLLYVVMGIAMINGAFPEEPGKPDLSPEFGWIFVAIGTSAFAVGWAYAICVLLAGRMLGKRRRHTFCLVVAALECLFLPFGTILAVFTIFVLMRPSVKALFQASESAAAQSSAI